MHVSELDAGDDLMFANRPATCNKTWMRSGADFGSNLSQDQMRTLGDTYRGWDNNAACFPGGNENAAIATIATDHWVDGLSNTSHD